MITFQEYLNEAFDKPYPYKWATKESTYWEAKATVNGSSTLKVHMNGEDKSGGEWDIFH